MRFTTVLIAVLATTSAGPAAAADQDLEAIRRAAHDLVASRTAAGAGVTRIDVRPLDPRLRLPACELPLSTQLPDSSPAEGNLLVSVRCEGARPWSLFVPVSVRTLVAVVVMTRTLPRGGVVTIADVALDTRPVNALTGGYYGVLEDVIGKVTSRPVAAGTALNPLMLSAALVVRRGQRVTLSTAVGAISVRSAGTVLADAALGERVQVRSLSSQRIVEGRVAGDGLVDVGE